MGGGGATRRIDNGASLSPVAVLGENGGPIRGIVNDVFFRSFIVAVVLSVW